MDRMNFMRGVLLKENEKIIAIVRRYGLTFFGHFLLIALIFGAGFFFMFWLFKHGWWGQSIFGVIILTGLYTLIRTLIRWRKTMLIITSHRVIDIEQKSLIEKIISEVPYDQIEDIAGRTKGIFGTVFRYGRLTIQTGGGKVRIIVDRVKQPAHVLQLVNHTREQYLSRHP